MTTATRTIVAFCAICALLLGGSAISTRLWGGKPEKPANTGQLSISREMTVAEFGRVNGLPTRELKGLFGLRSDAELGRKITDFGNPEQIARSFSRKRALAAEHASKNWLKIPLKFALWFLFLSFVFFTLRRRKLINTLRLRLLGMSVLLFGVLLGADPNPMGTVKDAIHLYGTAGVIFPPRMIALGVLLSIVLLANKFICAWGCQSGALQELLYRINSTAEHQPRLGRKIRLSFALSNGIRIAFFSAFTLCALLMGTDIIAPIDPFKVYSPAALTLGGCVFIGLLLLGSMFIYRPWCHLFCPFGLAGWLLERFSRVKIYVDYGTCIACGSCAEACPSTVMEAILRRDRKVIPDCFSCYTCRDACPTGAVRFSSQRK